MTGRVTIELDVGSIDTIQRALKTSYTATPPSQRMERVRYGAALTDVNRAVARLGEPQESR